MADCCVNPVCRSEFRLPDSSAFSAYGQPVTNPSGEWGSHEHGLYL